MSKKASSYFFGDPVKIPLGEKQLRTASAVESVGDAQIQLFKVRSTGQLVVSKTRFYEALSSINEVAKSIDSSAKESEDDSSEDPEVKALY